MGVEAIVARAQILSKKRLHCRDWFSILFRGLEFLLFKKLLIVLLLTCVDTQLLNDG